LFESTGAASGAARKLSSRITAPENSRLQVKFVM
jgi:hypothetical protein